MTLHEKGVVFQTIEEDLKNFSDELRSLHPEAKVPVLVHGDRVLYESAIITEYIEESFSGGVALMPPDPELRAEVRLWTYWCNVIFKPDVDRYKYGSSRFSQEQCLGIEGKIKEHLRKMDSRLCETGWLVGSDLSLADIHVFPFYRQLARMNPAPVFLSDYSNLQKWLEKLTQRPSFMKAMEK